MKRFSLFSLLYFPHSLFPSLSLVCVWALLLPRASRPINTTLVRQLLEKSHSLEHYGKPEKKRSFTKGEREGLEARRNCRLGGGDTELGSGSVEGSLLGLVVHDCWVTGCEGDKMA